MMNDLIDLTHEFSLLSPHIHLGHDVNLLIRPRRQTDPTRRTLTIEI